MSQAVDPRTDPLLNAVPECEGFRVLDRRYVIYETIGQGGMGVVFKGRHAELEVDVAIKCLDPSLARRSNEFVARFKKEARAAARIRHENVIQVIDVAEASGVHFLVMEFVQGEDARQRVVRKGQLAIDEAMRIALGAACGLAAAHRSGMVHRDIKPDNILIGVDGAVKVADLGLAKFADSDTQLTVTGATMGTPLYMPPEQFGDVKNVGPPADVYSLGATLYFLLTGRDAIPHGSLYEVADCIRSQPFPDPRDVRTELPAEIAELVLACTRKDASHRPQQAGEVAGVLKAVLAEAHPDLVDPEAGSLAAISLVSPPPAEILARIRTSFSTEVSLPDLPYEAEAMNGRESRPAISQRERIQARRRRQGGPARHKRRKTAEHEQHAEKASPKQGAHPRVAAFLLGTALAFCLLFLFVLVIALFDK